MRGIEPETDNARYMFEHTLHRGLRRAAEIRESAVTYDEFGLAGGLGTGSPMSSS